MGLSKFSVRCGGIWVKTRFQLMQMHQLKSDGAGAFLGLRAIEVKKRAGVVSEQWRRSSVRRATVEGHNARSGKSSVLAPWLASSLAGSVAGFVRHSFAVRSRPLRTYRAMRIRISGPTRGVALASGECGERLSFDVMVVDCPGA
jgi:hypothetical protein